MNIVTGTTATLGKHLADQMASYRHKVFVETLGWDLNCEPGVELDQFDRADTVYVLALDDEGDIVGISRLLETTRPYLLGDVFPQLLNGMPLPSSSKVWELSRFAAMDFKSSLNTPLSQMSSPIACALFHASIAAAANLGAESMVTVSPLGVERLLRKAGIRAHRAGPPMVIDGYALFACWIDCLAAPAHAEPGQEVRREPIPPAYRRQRQPAAFTQSAMAA